jgi:holo-[acyl-carrier protein] synthase
VSLRVGTDLVRVSRIAESLATFGERFLRRIFTEQEIAYATRSPSQTAERLAARFAAKEATMKALGRQAAWRQIEVVRAEDGRCSLALHGDLTHDGELAVSLSHEGDLATAVVVYQGK